MAFDHDLLDIRTKFRELTGRPSTNQISDVNCNNEINAYYQHIFPYDINVHEFDGFTTFNTVDGTETYTQPATVLSIDRPVTAKDSDDVIYPVDLYTDVGLFKADYPDDAHDEADEEDRPAALLRFNRTFYLRPVPDAVYQIKYPSKAQLPTALAADDSTPTDEMWWLLLAYGAAITYLNNNREFDAAQQHSGMYKTQKGMIIRKQVMQTPIGTRAMPRW